jgi:ribosomal-protein-alanine N-acetyltransferase
MPSTRPRSTIRLRLVGPYDLRALAGIHDVCFGSESWGERSLAEVIRMPGALGRVAIDAGKGDRAPVGFHLCRVAGTEAELLTVAVLPDRRREGVGRLLLQDFVRTALAAGSTTAFLEVAEDNDPAFQLYRDLGFEQVGRRVNYYRRPGGLWIAARVLRRDLACPG